MTKLNSITEYLTYNLDPVLYPVAHSDWSVGECVRDRQRRRAAHSY